MYGFDLFEIRCVGGDSYALTIKVTLPENGIVELLRTAIAMHQVYMGHIRKAQVWDRPKKRTAKRKK